MHKILITIILVVSIGCSDPEMFDVDANCTQEEIEAIERAIEKINDGGNEDFFAVNGVVEVDYDKPMSNVVVCTRDAEATIARWPSMEGVVGRKSGSVVIVRTDILELHDVEGTAMHEFMHMLGATNDDHTDDPNDVFYGHLILDAPIELSDDDIGIIARVAGR